MTDPNPDDVEHLDDVEGVDDEEVVDPQDKAKAIIAALPDPDPKVLLELAVEVCTEAPLPWQASNGRLYWDDDKPNPHDRAETIIARFGTDPKGTLKAQYVAQAASAAAALVKSIYEAQRRAMDSRGQAGRLADAIDAAIETGGVDTPAAQTLQAAVKSWEESLSQQGLSITHGPLPSGAGVSYVPPDA